MKEGEKEGRKEGRKGNEGKKKGRKEGRKEKKEGRKEGRKGSKEGCWPWTLVIILPLGPHKYRVNFSQVPTVPTTHSVIHVTLRCSFCPLEGSADLLNINPALQSLFSITNAY